ncbi:MAG: large conductance mechanosensitive channel protein MscL [Clostridiales bacterium]|nr:large conductance mechanosensitive channel protein MscL [Clostridiales bacterium]
MKRIKNFFGEFKKFITRGNVLDMAVGVIIGGAFTAIVNGLSNFILKPIINWIIALFVGDNGLENAVTFLGDPVYTDGVIDLTKSIYIDWGAFISAIINFLLIAFVLFMIVRTMNRIAKAKEDAFGEDAKSIKKEVKKIRKENGCSWDDALAIYAERVAEKKAAEEAAAAEAAAKAAEEARIAEEKAMANTKLLEEIRDLLKQT